jgi:hypothetical protein
VRIQSEIERSEPGIFKALLGRKQKTKTKQPAAKLLTTTAIDSPAEGEE